MTRWIFYHAHCLDGFGAAYAAWRKFGYGDAVYRACRYDEGEDPFDLCEPGDEVFVLDFSFERNILLRQSRRLKLLVLDHHKTAEADLSGLDFCQFNLAKSGAVLAWEHFHPGTAVPLLLLHIQDRDLWKFEIRYTKEITTALRYMPMDFELWRTAADDPLFLAEVGGIQLQVLDEQVKELASKAGWLGIRGHRVPAVQSRLHQSELGHALLELHPEAQFAVVFFDFQPEGETEWSRTYSLRAERGFDVGELAKSFGGGGHKTAAGFTVKLGRESHGHRSIVPLPSRDPASAAL